MSGGGEPQGTRRVGPLGIAVGLALVPALVGVTTLAVKSMRTPAKAVAPPVRTATPAPTPQPTPHATLHSTVAPGVDVVYWANWDGAGGPPYVLHAVDMSGHDRGAIDLPATTDSARSNQQPNLSASPDGSALLIDTDVYASNGAWLGTTEFNGDTVWADDSTHLCHLGRTAGLNGVEVDLLGLSGRRQASATMPSTEPESGDAMTLLGCSATTMRAEVLLSTTPQGVGTQVVDLDLRTGGFTVGRTLCTGNCIAPPVASRDASLIAYAGADRHPAVLDVATGARRPLAVRGMPLAFSGDGRALVVDLDTPRSSTMPQRLPGIVLVDWRTGRVEWSRANGVTLPQWVFPVPAPGAIAVAVCDYHGGTGAFPPGPCNLDLLTATANGVPRVAQTAQGLDVAFGWGPF